MGEGTTQLVWIDVLRVLRRRDSLHGVVFHTTGLSTGKRLKNRFMLICSFCLTMRCCSR
ncbi:hypothetical protein M404DRAFT_1002875 [Pisolithus tinctorius Marx 270]|uniref:Uncharacterized protein n=1 Tax=Pisolithus tinctorius Marx 270 TaxID=870435 RepID=A0A0C3IY55_PISTI|nr:hypothetical protein M404DRAFT_1002875 [Pisolithus tinctorius Marx 270]